MSIKEIQSTKPSIVKNWVKKHVDKCAFNDLTRNKNQDKNEKFVVFERLETSEYLLPECKISVEHRIEFF